MIHKSRSGADPTSLRLNDASAHQFRYMEKQPCRDAENVDVLVPLFAKVSIYRIST